MSSPSEIGGDSGRKQRRSSITNTSIELSAIGGRDRRHSSVHTISTTLRDTPELWKAFSVKNLPHCNIKGELHDISGGLLCTFVAKKTLGGGTFGQVDAFTRTDPEGGSIIVAIKRPKFHEMNLISEALFQWKLHHDLKDFGLSFCVPQIYDIFVYQPTGDVWFSMEAFEPVFLSTWCMENPEKFHIILLQIALILEVLENELHVDHRDLKINNIIIVTQPITITIEWEHAPRIIIFPFRVVFVDFGFACCSNTIDIKNTGHVPGLDPCPKEGRNMFQVLASIWNNSSLRKGLESSWGNWIRERILTTVPRIHNLDNITTRFHTLDWMYTLTDIKEFRAPLCAPRKIIKECMRILDRVGCT